MKCLVIGMLILVLLVFARSVNAQQTPPLAFEEKTSGEVKYPHKVKADFMEESPGVLALESSGSEGVFEDDAGTLQLNDENENKDVRLQNDLSVEGDVSIQSDKKLYFDSEKTVFTVYDSANKFLRHYIGGVEYMRTEGI